MVDPTAATSARLRVIGLSCARSAMQAVSVEASDHWTVYQVGRGWRRCRCQFSRSSVVSDEAAQQVSFSLALVPSHRRLFPISDDPRWLEHASIRRCSEDPTLTISEIVASTGRGPVERDGLPGRVDAES